jgi:hypothetical protein
MSRATKRQIRTLADLIASAQHYANEVGLPYVIVFEGQPTLFSNATPRHALTILRDAVELQDKMQELRLEEMAAKLTAIPNDDGGAKA